MHLVTGGSGFIGSTIARLLCERGERVRVLDIWRDPEMHTDIDYVECDINDVTGVERAMSGVDYVHHNVALVPLAKAGKRFQEVNVGGTRVALEAARKQGVRMFGHMSSSAIFGLPKSVPITNDTPLEPVEIYGRAKRDADVLVRKAGSEGMPVSVIRPRTTVGPGRLGIFEILFEWIRDDASIYTIGPGDHLFQFVHADDLAEVSIECCLQEVAGTFNVGTDRFGTLREDLEGLIRHAGTASKVKRLPEKPAVLALKMLDFLRLSPLGPYHYLAYQHPYYFDISPVRNALGWAPRYSNLEILCSAYDWYVGHAKTAAGSDNESMHKRSVKQGILRLLKAMS